MRFAHGDLWDPVEGTFDLISANTPFLLLPEQSRALSGHGGRYGLDVTQRIYERFDQRLRADGQSHIVISTAYVSGRSLLDETLHELFDGKGYRMELQPISTYYDPNIHQTYQSRSGRAFCGDTRTTVSSRRSASAGTGSTWGRGRLLGGDIGQRRRDLRPVGGPPRGVLGEHARDEPGQRRRRLQPHAVRGGRIVEEDLGEHAVVEHQHLAAQVGPAAERVLLAHAAVPAEGLGGGEQRHHAGNTSI